MTDIIKPININLYYENILQQKGGVRPLADFIDKFKPIITDYIASERDEYIFHIDKILNNNKDTNLYYIGKGTYTLVIKIKLTTTKKLDFNNTYKDNLIIKISDNFDSTYITKWQEDKKNYDKHIHDIFFYGTLFKKRGLPDELSKYIITREYSNSDNILKFPLYKQLNFIKSFFEFIIKLISKKQYYWDCKFVNMGCDENLTYIVLDHDKDTLVDKNTFIKENRFIYNYYGTYSPIYISYLFIKKSDEYNHTLLDKVYSIGCANMIIKILNKLFSKTIIKVNEVNKTKSQKYIFFLDKINLTDLANKISDISSIFVNNIIKNLLIYLNIINLDNEIEKAIENKVMMNVNFENYFELYRRIEDAKKDSNFIKTITSQVKEESVNKFLYESIDNKNDIDIIKNKYDDLIKNPKISDLFNNINNDNFDESNNDDIELSNTIINFLITILLECLHLDFAKVPDINRLTVYINKIDFLSGKITKLCKIVETYKGFYPDFKFEYPKSIEKFLIISDIRSI